MPIIQQKRKEYLKLFPKGKESIELTATGYEWICPSCNRSHNISKVTKKVGCIYCEGVFKVSVALHTFSY